MKKYSTVFIVLSLVVFQACTGYRLVPASVEHVSYPVLNNRQQDSLVLRMLSPYRDSMSQTMSKVIGFATASLYEGKQENPLGLFFADAMKEMGEKKFGRPVHAAIMNPGGIRGHLAKGSITLGMMYNLMPFDNHLVLLALKGSVLKQLLDHSANGGGWPAAGITMDVRNHKAENILIQNRPVNEDSSYIIAIPDYVANGGDYTSMLVGQPQQSLGYLLRDALIDYVIQHTAGGRPVTANNEKRIRYAD